VNKFLVQAQTARRAPKIRIYGIYSGAFLIK